LAGIYENTGQEWAEKMGGLLIEIKDWVERYKGTGKEVLSTYLIKKFSLSYDELVEEGMRRNPIAVKSGNKRGRTKQSKARLLAERLLKRKEDYLRFSRDFLVPFDNNQAERDFRISKVKQKVSGGFRSLIGGESFAILQSVIQTLHKHKLNILNELANAFRSDYSLPIQSYTTE
jgi:transposase